MYNFDMVKNPRIEDLKASDRVDGYPAQTPKWLKRVLEVVPGVLVWFFVLSPIIFALIGLEEIFIFYISFLIIYWVFRGIKFVVGIAIGIRRMRRDLNTDFVSKIREEGSKEFDELSYIYLCPVYKEGLDILEPSFEAWSKSDVGAEKIHVVVAMEESTAKSVQIPNYEILKEKYGNQFASMQYYVHPKNIEGEALGVKGANINWATRNFVEKLESEGRDISKYLLITCDCDLRPDPKYLSAVTYKYLTVEDPEKKYYTSAIYTLNNNIWRVPTLIRVQSSMLTLVTLHNWTIDKYEHTPFLKSRFSAKETFSSYIVNLKTLKNVHFWDPQLGIDDSTFFWNALIRFEGNFTGEEVYIPTHSDAVENESMVKSYKSFYKQQHRWGWGVIVFPTTLAALIYDKRIPFLKKIYIIIAMYRQYIFFITVVYLMTFGLSLLGLFSKDYLFSSASYNLPNAMSFLLTILLLCNVFIVYYRRKITPIPKGWKWWRHLIDFGEVALIAVQMLSFGFIPYLQADTEMMLGRGFKKNFYATDKVKMK
jgi:hypothetical protein